MANIAELIGSWGLYSLFENENDPNVHPEDFQQFRSIRPDGKIFYCVGVQGDYVLLRFDKIKYRVKPERYFTIPEPKYKIGDRVIDGNHPLKTGIIRSSGWHFKEQKHIYAITLNGKNKSRRYFERDLESVTDNLDNGHS